MASSGASTIFNPLTSRKYQTSNSLDPSSPITGKISNTSATIVMAEVSDIGITGRLRRSQRARNDRGEGRTGQTETRPLLGIASSWPIATVTGQGASPMSRIASRMADGCCTGASSSHGSPSAASPAANVWNRIIRSVRKGSPTR